MAVLTSGLSATARAIDADAPAYYTLAWNRLRLLIGQGKADEARAELDRIIAMPALPEGVDSLMRYQRLKLARDIGEFVKFALRRGEFVMYLYDERTGLGATALPLSAASVQIARSARPRFGLSQMPPYTTSAIKSSKPGTAARVAGQPRRAASCWPRSLNFSRDMDLLPS